MLGFFQKRTQCRTHTADKMEIPLENIRKIDRAGILYIDPEGNSASIRYADAHKGWCKSKSVKKSNSPYICDRTKADGWKIIFYTNPQVIFVADADHGGLWNDVLNRIWLQGYRSFDYD